MAKTRTSFKKGEVHNPTGRPKKEWTWSGLLEEAMEEQNESGEPYKKLIVRKLRALGLKGDMVAIKELFNRMDGMPQQPMEHSGSITVEFHDSLKQDEE